MSIIEILKKRLRDAINAVYGEYPSKEITVEAPPKIELGDFAVECFSLAGQFKKSPMMIAQEIVEELKKDDFATYEAVGAYINVRVNNEKLFGSVCQGGVNVQPKNGQTVMVEYLSPNTNKPLHLGHMRNGVLGMATSAILDFSGYDVVRANLVNDRGIHICKSMLAWKKFANGATPESTGRKGDHFVGDYYVLFAQKSKEDPTLLDEAQNMLEQWEAGDSEVVELWKMMNSWVYAGFAETYKNLGFKFDTEYHESEIYKDGKAIVQNGYEKGIFQKEDSGAIVFNLPEEKFGVNEDGAKKKVTLLRDNGTSVYVTQDIAVGVKKSTDYNLDASVYVVGSEQEYYFKTLFAVFEALGYSWAKRCYHLSYGMVDLPSGKMKSREGTVIDADDLLQDVKNLVAADLKERHSGRISDEEILSRAQKIALGAIKFFFLKSSPKNKITFDSKQSISFEGKTGPYIQYAYTRAVSALKNAKKEGIIPTKDDFKLLGDNPEERLIAQKLAFLSDEINKAALEYDPAVIANTAYELAKVFHLYYNNHKFIIEDKELSSQRLALVGAVAQALKTMLNLLGIDVLEEM